MFLQTLNAKLFFHSVSLVFSIQCAVSCVFYENTFSMHEFLTEVFVNVSVNFAAQHCKILRLCTVILFYSAAPLNRIFYCAAPQKTCTVDFTMQLCINYCAPFFFIFTAQCKITVLYSRYLIEHLSAHFVFIYR